MADIIETTTIMLGGEAIKISALPFGKLRHVLSAWKGLLSGDLMDPDCFSTAMGIIAVAINRPIEEVEQIPTTAPEIWKAIGGIAKVSGLVTKETATPEDTPAGE